MSKVAELEDEKIPKYKPLPKNSKFAKPNKQGQIPKDCIYFDWCENRCWDSELGNYEDVSEDCKVLKGEYCIKYKRGNL